MNAKKIGTLYALCSSIRLLEALEEFRSNDVSFKWHTLTCFTITIGDNEIRPVYYGM